MPACACFRALLLDQSPQRCSVKCRAVSALRVPLVSQGLTEWWTECALMVRISKDGKRVVEVREFVHSAKAEELKRRLTGVLES